ncbi:MAG TPA: pyridoxamine 5'-phosphate oxidase [Candidatus Nanopelagicales bacterium]|nr:pyridoxamine 5'-phosphate oxidase [Candidatus Nanopelagicales bacterium]
MSDWPVPDPAAMRVGYDREGLLEESAPDDPLELFGRWFAEVAAGAAGAAGGAAGTGRAGGVAEPNAVVVATVTPDGWPAARTVLLKGYDSEGLRFFTGTGSAKAGQLAATPRAALVFPWHQVHRQVRVTGTVRRLPDDVVAAYFATRPRDSQLGAWASPQSAVVGSRAELDARLAEVAARFPEGEPVPVPPHWGGYLVVPVEWEFWVGRSGRLHDRLRYVRPEGSTTRGPWTRERLAP